MKRTVIALVSAAAFTLGLSTIGYAAETESAWYPTFEQTASAWLDQDGTEVRVTVDLTDGWSASFAHGAVYLYDGPDKEGTEAVAIGLTLDEEVFNDYAEEASSKDSYREFAHCFTFTEEDGSNDYFWSLSPDVYFMIAVRPQADGDIVSSRFSMELADSAEETATESSAD